MADDILKAKMSSSSNIKTYSRKGSAQTSVGASLKRRREEQPRSEVLDLPPAKAPKREGAPVPELELPQVNFFDRTSIRAYFKPIAKASNPPSVGSTVPSSDPAHLDSTPPSSPPLPLLRPLPRGKRRLTSRPNLPAISKMAFNDLSRDIDAVSDAFTDVENATETHHSRRYGDSRKSSTELLLPKVNERTLVQTQLASTQVHCVECGMLYDKTSRSDVKEHDMYHAAGHLKLQKCKPLKTEFILGRTDGTAGKFIFYKWDREAKPQSLRPLFEELLDNKFLSSIAIPRDELWGETIHPLTQRPLPMYQVMVVVAGDEVIGLALAKYTALAGFYYSGRPIADQYGWLGKHGWGSENEVQQFICRDDSRRVHFSVERIWVVDRYRRLGLATKLVDNLREYFLPNWPVQPQEICFSWPTTEGAMFAKKYCLNHFETRLGFEPYFLVNLEEPGPYVEKGRIGGLPPLEVDKGDIFVFEP